MYVKDFDGWTKVKKDINLSEERVHINNGDVRWVSFGVNVASEIDGKGVSFTRPAIVLKVIGNNLALVLPMSTKIKSNVPGYKIFLFKNKDVSLCISQIKVISQKRIFMRMTKLPKSKLTEIMLEVNNFYKFK